MVFSLPFFSGLQCAWNQVAAERGTSLRWVAVGHAAGAALFQDANPELISECVLESGGRNKLDPWALLRRWRENRPVAVINLSQSVRLALAAWMARVPVRAGDVNNRLAMLYHHGFQYRDLEVPIVRRFGALLEPLTGQHNELTMPELNPDLLGGRRAPEVLRAHGWDGEPYVTLAFGTRGYPKRWFPEDEKWPALARIFMAQGLRVVWLGGGDERELGARLAALAPGSLDITGQTSIPEAVALQHGAYGNISVDTGLGHTAAATGAPVVTLMGPTREQYFTPQGPYSLTIRGLEVGPDGAGDAHNSASHRIAPERVADLLHLLANERRQKSITPAI